MSAPNSNSNPTTSTPAATLQAPFKPTALIPNSVTLIPKEAKFRNNVFRLAQFYEEHNHYSVTKSDKTLYHFVKNMKSIIRSKREGVSTDRRITDVQFRLLRDIRFVEYTTKLEKSKKQHPLTKAFRNVLASVDGFREQNGHTDLLHPDAKYVTTIKHCD